MFCGNSSLLYSSFTVIFEQIDSILCSSIFVSFLFESSISRPVIAFSVETLNIRESFGMWLVANRPRFGFVGKVGRDSFASIEWYMRAYSFVEKRSFARGVRMRVLNLSQEEIRVLAKL